MTAADPADDPLLEELLELQLLSAEELVAARRHPTATTREALVKMGLFWPNQLDRIERFRGHLIAVCYGCMGQVMCARAGWQGHFDCPGCGTRASVEQGTAGLAEQLLLDPASRVVDRLVEKVLLDRKWLSPERLEAARQARLERLPRPSLQQVLTESGEVDRSRLRSAVELATRAVVRALPDFAQLTVDYQLARFLRRHHLVTQKAIGGALKTQLDAALNGQLRSLVDLLAERGELTEWQRQRYHQSAPATAALTGARAAGPASATVRLPAEPRAMTPLAVKRMSPTSTPPPRPVTEPFALPEEPPADVAPEPSPTAEETQPIEGVPGEATLSSAETIPFDPGAETISAAATMPLEDPPGEADAIRRASAAAQTKPLPEPPPLAGAPLPELPEMSLPLIGPSEDSAPAAPLTPPIGATERRERAQAQTVLRVDEESLADSSQLATLQATPAPAAAPAPAADPGRGTTERLGRPQTAASSIHQRLKLTRSGISLTAGVDRGGEVTGEGDKYEELRELGRGAMGRVVLWRDNNLRRVVACKQILELRTSGEALQRFVEEGQIAGQLEHPGIIPIYDLGLDAADNLYFTMKFVKGQTLGELIEVLNKPGGKALEEWSLFRVLQMFQLICHALDFAHSKHVIHRDLKPDNIMLGDFGEVLVMDWGLAKVRGQGTEVLSSEDSISTLREQGGYATITGQIAGTPFYMAPEQARGEIERIDPRSDVYALGAILYELLAGHRTVEAPTVLELLRRVSKGLLIALPRRGPFGGIAPELRSIVARALATEADGRYPSAGQLARDIQCFMDGRRVAAHRYSALDRLRRGLRRYRREVLLIGGTLVVAVLVGLLWQRQQSQNVGAQLVEAAERRLNDARFRDNEGKLLLLDEQPIKVVDPQSSYKAREQLEAARTAFPEFTDTMLQAIRELRRARAATGDAALTTRAAGLWLRVFDAAQKIGDGGWQSTAASEIRDLVGAERFDREYRDRLAGRRPVRIEGSAGQPAFLFKYYEAGRWSALAPIAHRAGQPDVTREDLDYDDKGGPREASPGPTSAVAPLPADLRLRRGSYRIQWKHGDRVLTRLLRVDRALDPNVPVVLTPPKLTAPPALLARFALIPRTRFLAGGDAVGALASRHETAGPLLIQRTEVTFAEYLVFLDDAVGAAGEGRFARWLGGLCAEQARRPGGTQRLGALIDLLLVRDGRTIRGLADLRPALTSGTLPAPGAPLDDASLDAFCAPLIPRTFQEPLAARQGRQMRVVPSVRKEQGWSAWPVFGLPHHACQLYALWLSVRDGRRYRLPTELEWELAARGVDGRSYSWGERYWHGAAKLNAGYGGRTFDWATKAPSTTYDRSPWGVADLGGSLGEWTSSRFADERDRYTIKGNIWGLTPEGIKCAFRVGESEHYFHPTLGFRLAIDLSGE